MRIIYIFLPLLLVSCHVKVNQYVEISKDIKKRNGYWIEKYQDKDGKYLSKGRYSLGERVGVWKSYINGHFVQKDKIRGEVTETKILYIDGKLWQKGQSKIGISPKERHWYYYGDWKFYDKKGKLQYIKKYEFGKKVDRVSYQ